MTRTEYIPDWYVGDVESASTEENDRWLADKTLARTSF